MAGQPPDPALVARLAALRDGFVAGLARREASIVAAVQANDHAALDAALHQLAGAAGSYGFERLGQLARLAMADPGQGLEPLLQDMRATLSSQSGGLPDV